jgi:hypothetical protein
MEFDLTVKVTDIAIVLAALAGPVLAVQAQKWLERRRDVTERRLSILRTLLATRSATLSLHHVEALNAVPVEFYGNDAKLKAINEAWKLYLDHHDDRLEFGDAWAQKRLDLYLDLLHEIARFLGYKFTRTQLGRDIYSPKAHGDLEYEQNVIRKGLADLFVGKGSLPLSIKEMPESAAGSSELQAAIEKIILTAAAETRPSEITKVDNDGVSS